MQATH